MCEPISFVQTENGDLYHLHKNSLPFERFETVHVYPGDPGINNADSHTDICWTFGLSEDWDGVAKYEAQLYDLTFATDHTPKWVTRWHLGIAQRWAEVVFGNLPRIAVEDDSFFVQLQAMRQIEDREAVPEIVKGIKLWEMTHPVNPLAIKPSLPQDEVRNLLAQWASQDRPKRLLYALDGTDILGIDTDSFIVARDYLIEDIWTSARHLRADQQWKEFLEAGAAYLLSLFVNIDWETELGLSLEPISQLWHAGYIPAHDELDGLWYVYYGPGMADYYLWPDDALLPAVAEKA